METHTHVNMDSKREAGDAVETVLGDVLNDAEETSKAATPAF